MTRISRGREGGRDRRAFTIVELIAVVLMSALLAPFVLSVMSSGVRRHGCCGRPMRDATQVRNIVQALQIWAQANKDQYPLPSALDTANDTIAAADAFTKNTSANILSVLIWNGSISPEICVSPKEQSPDIAVDDRYENTNPKAAANPSRALWDPHFNDDFTERARLGASGRAGNISYGMTPPVGARAARWTNTFNATEAILGNRGPQVSQVVYGADGRASPVFAASNSVTYLTSGNRRSWAGNVGYNDGHVNIETRTSAAEIQYRSLSGKLHEDCFFFDEPDDPTGSNAFLSIFPKAGATLADFKFIWD